MMKIAAIGPVERVEELRLRLGNAVDVLHIDSFQALPAGIEILFDLDFDDSPGRAVNYAGDTAFTIIGCTVKRSIAELFSQQPTPSRFIGMNLLPGFINRPLAEISLPSGSENDGIAKTVFSSLNWDYRIVGDRVGMVTPRVIFMIINEAYFTLQEGTASIEDIDVSMKLGTNYPYGPFEWAKKIGIKTIYETLDAVYHDTHDERYKICPLLKTEYLNR